ncbi:MAG: LapA family protein [Tomitella sp.]|nr:LapA family protein [Tomitella sp.]
MATMKNALSKVSFAQWLGLLIAVLAIVFVFTNTNTTEITLYGLHLSGPTWLILLIILAIGWLIGLLTGRRQYKRR